MAACAGVTGFPFQPAGRTPPGHLEARAVYAIRRNCPKNEPSWPDPMACGGGLYRIVRCNVVFALFSRDRRWQLPSKLPTRCECLSGRGRGPMDHAGPVRLDARPRWDPDQAVAPPSGCPTRVSVSCGRGAARGRPLADQGRLAVVRRERIAPLSPPGARPPAKCYLSSNWQTAWLGSSRSGASSTPRLSLGFANSMGDD
jgi:hypothetical protein